MKKKIPSLYSIHTHRRPGKLTTSRKTPQKTRCAEVGNCRPLTWRVCATRIRSVPALWRKAEGATSLLINSASPQQRPLWSMERVRCESDERQTAGACTQTRTSLNALLTPTVEHNLYGEHGYICGCTHPHVFSRHDGRAARSDNLLQINYGSFFFFFGLLVSLHLHPFISLMTCRYFKLCFAEVNRNLMQIFGWCFSTFFPEAKKQMASTTNSQEATK